MNPMIRISTLAMCVALFWNQASAQTPADGRRPYQTRCAGCHGEDGTGGGHGPGIVDVRRPRAASKNEVRDLILKGIPGGGMPPFQIPIEEADAIAAFVMTLKTPVDGTVIREKTLMPKVEATAEETRDLVAYLSRLAVDPNSKAVLATREIGAGVRFADIAGPKPGTWPTYDGNLSGNRFSPLKQIDTSNVAQLAPKWMFSIPGARRALEVTPVVVDSVMYVTSVNEAYALDARSGREIWHYSRPRSQGLAGDAAGGINRGVAVLGDRVFMVSDNAHLFALHRFTGQLIWDVEMADSHQNYGSTSAPLVVNDLVIAGVSGGDEGIRGFLDAYKCVYRRARLALLDYPGAGRAWARKLGAGGRWNTVVAPRGSPAPTTRKPGCSTGPPAIPARITTATSARETICTPRQYWRWTPLSGSLNGITSSRRTTCTTGTPPKRPCWWTRSSTASPASCCSRATETDSSMCWTASPARCCWPSRLSGRSPGPAVSAPMAGPSYCRGMSRRWKAS